MIAGKLYVDTNRNLEKTLIIAGTARSGTTWLADIVASQVSCRMMFEPFNSNLVKDYENFNYFQYMRPGEENRALASFTEKILTGAIRDPWIDKQVEHIFPEYRLIKTIRANLLLKWLKTSFPQVSVVLIIRHPCAVVSSRMKLAWWADRDIAPLLSQPKLITDYLTDKIEFIESVRTEEEKHAIIWCVNTLVPLKQFQAGSLPIIFYENLCMQPEIELPKVFSAFRIKFQKSAYKAARRPSTTSLSSSAILTGSDLVTHWQTQLSDQQVKNILKVVDAFELGWLYGDSSVPISQGWNGTHP